MWRAAAWAHRNVPARLTVCVRRPLARGPAVLRPAAIRAHTHGVVGRTRRPDGRARERSRRTARSFRRERIVRVLLAPLARGPRGGSEPRRRRGDSRARAARRDRATAALAVRRAPSRLRRRAASPVPAYTATTAASWRTTLYHQPRDRIDRRHPRRRPGHAHALADAEGPARPLRAPDDRLARRGRARGGARARSSSSTARTRPLDGHLPDGVELAVQPEPDGTGGAVRAAVDHHRRRPVLVLNGDVPLVTAEALRAPARGPRGRGRRRRRSRRWCSTTPPATGASSAAPTAPSRASSRPRSPATRPPRSSRSARSTPASTPSTAPRCTDALQRLRTDNAQGELYLPDASSLLDARRRARRSTTRRSLLGVNDRVELAARPRARPGAHPPRPHARGRHDRRPGHHADRRRRSRIGPDTVVEPSTFLRGATTIGEGCTIGPLTTLIDATLGDEVRVPHSYLVDCEVARRRQRRARSPTCARARCCARARRSARSSRSRTPTSARARRSRTSATSATPTSARARTSAPRRSPPTTTARTSTARRSARGVRTAVDTTLRRAGHGRRRRLHRRRTRSITEDVPPGALGIARERQHEHRGLRRPQEARAASTPS